MTGWSHTVGVVLILAGCLCLLVGAAMLFVDRHRSRHRAGVPPDTPLDEFLEPTTVLPIVAQAPRHAGALFMPYDGPFTPEPEDPTTSHHPGERS